MTFDFDAYVTAARFDKAGRPAFALGDGTVRLVVDQGFATVEAHDGAVLSSADHPSGSGLLTGGDDGRVAWTRLEGDEVVATEIASVKGRWIDSVAASAESGLIAFSAGRELHVRDAKDAAFTRVFTHEKSIADVTFDPKGRRIAAATYNGAALWYARIEGQKPVFLKWAGAHSLVVWSPDGKFLMSAMQENSLHGWKVSDEKNMRMGGYPAKVKSMSFLSGGVMMATSGSHGVVVWPFSGSTGPMGKEAAEIGFEQSAMVVRVATTPALPIVTAGLDDGRVWVADLKTGRIDTLKAERGAAISALAITPDGRRIAWGDENGAAGIVEREL